MENKLERTPSLEITGKILVGDDFYEVHSMKIEDMPEAVKTAWQSFCEQNSEDTVSFSFLETEGPLGDAYIAETEGGVLLCPVEHEPPSFYSLSCFGQDEDGKDDITWEKIVPGEEVQVEPVSVSYVDSDQQRGKWPQTRLKDCSGKTKALVFTGAVAVAVAMALVIDKFNSKDENPDPDNDHSELTEKPEDLSLAPAPIKDEKVLEAAPVLSPPDQMPSLDLEIKKETVPQVKSEFSQESEILFKNTLPGQPTPKPFSAHFARPKACDGVSLPKERGAMNALSLVSLNNKRVLPEKYREQKEDIPLFPNFKGRMLSPTVCVLEVSIGAGPDREQESTVIKCGFSEELDDKLVPVVKDNELWHALSKRDEQGNIQWVQTHVLEDGEWVWCKWLSVEPEVELLPVEDDQYSLSGEEFVGSSLLLPVLKESPGKR